MDANQLLPEEQMEEGMLGLLAASPTRSEDLPEHMQRRVTNQRRAFPPTEAQRRVIGVVIFTT